jgi:hypothetical protein
MLSAAARGCHDGTDIAQHAGGEFAVVGAD